MTELYRLLGEILTSLDSFLILCGFFTWHENYQTLVGNGWVVHPIRCTPAQYRTTYDQMRRIFASERGRWLHWVADAWVEVEIMLMHFESGTPGESLLALAKRDPPEMWMRFWNAFVHGSPALHAQLCAIFHQHLRPYLLEREDRSGVSMRMLNTVVRVGASASVSERVGLPSTQDVLTSMGWESVLIHADMDPDDGRLYHVFGIRERGPPRVAGAA